MIVGGQSRGNVRRRAAQQDRNFTLQIEAGEVVIVLLRDFQPIADKHERSFDFFRSEVDASAEVGVFTQPEWLFGAIPNERSGRILFDNLSGNELYRLVVAICARRLKSSFGQLLNHIFFRFAEALAAGLAAFHVVICQNLDVIPPGFAIEVVRCGRLRPQIDYQP